MELIRSFIAVELPEEIKTELGRLQTSLKSNGPDWIKWVNPGSIHLTLKFLGDTANDKIGEILDGMSASVSGILPFRLQIKGLGVFPNLKRIRVVWVGIVGDLNSLQQLQNNVETILSALGYPEEEREFTPHLTLGRTRFQISPVEQQKFIALLNATGFESTCNIDVDAINLMKSQLTPRGAIYSKLGVVSLKNTP